MLQYEEMQVAKETVGFEPLNKAIDSIRHYVDDAWDSQYYDSKNKRLQKWKIDQGDIHELVVAIFTVALLNDRTTLQSVIGQVAGKITVEDTLDRAKIAAECIALCAHADLIEIDAGNTYIVYTKWNIDTGLDRSDKHVILTHKPQPKVTNQILGNRYKQHDEETCLDHINRMNSIKYSLNLPLIRMMEEQATFTIDTTQKAEQWDLFINESYKKYLQLARGDNEFYLEWKYDTRGRCYSEGYYINPQGSSFKKAITQLANKEVVQL